MANARLGYHYPALDATKTPIRKLYFVGTLFFAESFGGRQYYRNLCSALPARQAFSRADLADAIRDVRREHGRVRVVREGAA